MNGSNAFENDDDFYVEYDDEYEWHGVFGNQTGFCYFASYDFDRAEIECRDLIRMKESAVRRRKVK